MAWAGARGRTRREMASVLALGATEPGKMHAASAALLDALNRPNGQEELTLQVTDRLWGQKGLDFRPDYLRLLSDRYRAPLESVDFARATEAARVAINRWVAVQTRNRIREVLQPSDVSNATRLVLTNAVYLKAAWAVEFAKELTVDDPFTTPKGEGRHEDDAQAGELRVCAGTRRPDPRVRLPGRPVDGRRPPRCGGRSRRRRRTPRRE